MARPLSPGIFAAIISTPKVRRALRQRAEGIRGRAEAASRADKRQKQDNLPVFTVSQGIRPKGRPYARVNSTKVAEEFGAHGKARRRYLGQAIDG